MIPETELLIAVSPTSYLLDIEAFVNRIFILLLQCMTTAFAESAATRLESDDYDKLTRSFSGGFQ
ncbi:MAG: hypothetical protein DMG19_01785, partial [Acidobacteria bacterium]